ncbi:MAG: patatin-like phospholipase family protein [Bacteroidales bacterium]
MRKLVKAFIILVILASLSVLVFYLVSPGKDKITEVPVPKRSGTAIIMTGAAARIPQEAALLQELYNRKLLKNVVFISGVSSGALNSVALNGILSGKITWSEYKKILFGISNNNIYTQEGKKLPLNTEPERELLTKVIEKRLGYHAIGDLPYMTAISITNLKAFDLQKRIYRMCSRKINEETDTTLSIVDLLMASSAIPIAFPEVRIRDVYTIPDVRYVDGGVGDDHVPYHALLEFEKKRGIGVARVFIISRKSDSIPAVSEELKVLGINDKKLFDDLGVSIDDIMKKGIIKRLKAFKIEAPELVPLTYVWIPDFSRDFLMFNFDNLEEQFKITSEWARHHNPVPLDEYLKPYYNERKKEFE